jgi:hypothetical protein
MAHIAVEVPATPVHTREETVPKLDTRGGRPAALVRVHRAI